MAKSGQGTFSRHHGVLSKREMAQTTRINEEKTMECIIIALHETLMSLAAGGTSFSPFFFHTKPRNQVHRSAARLFNAKVSFHKKHVILFIFELSFS
jgi:hypothetical protein